MTATSFSLGAKVVTKKSLVGRVTAFITHMD